MVSGVRMEHLLHPRETSRIPIKHKPIAMLPWSQLLCILLSTWLPPCHRFAYSLACLKVYQQLPQPIWSPVWIASPSPQHACLIFVAEFGPGTIFKLTGSSMLVFILVILWMSLFTPLDSWTSFSHTLWKTWCRCASLSLNKFAPNKDVHCSLKIAEEYYAHFAD